MNFRIIPAIALLTLIALSCNKKTIPDPEKPATDSTDSTDKPLSDSAATAFWIGKGVPTDSVTWVIHMQGGTTADTNDPRSSFSDSNFHQYITVVANGATAYTAPGGSGTEQQYYIYKVSTRTVNKRVGFDITEVATHIYARYNEDNQSMQYFSALSSGPGQGSSGLNSGVSFDIDEVLANHRPCYKAKGWYAGEMKLVQGDPIMFNGVKCRTLYIERQGERYFYQADVIGGISGMLNCPYSVMSESQLVSMSFHYMRDSVKVEYPVKWD